MNTFCHKCGCNCKVDEDGFCSTCGFTATVKGVNAMISERDALKSEVARLVKQLPPTMLDCTIQFRKCPVGHGRLVATNWIDLGCQTCEIKRFLEAAREYGAYHHDYCESVTNAGQCSCGFDDALLGNQREKEKHVSEPVSIKSSASTTVYGPPTIESLMTERDKLLKDNKTLATLLSERLIDKMNQAIDTISKTKDQREGYTKELQAENERLKAQCKMLAEEDMKDFQKKTEWMQVANARLEMCNELRTENVRLLMALQNYGWHRGSCPCFRFANAECNCGLTKQLRSPKNGAD
jgi:hypothetical protein